MKRLVIKPEGMASEDQEPGKPKGRFCSALQVEDYDAPDWKLTAMCSFKGSEGFAPGEWCAGTSVGCRGISGKDKAWKVTEASACNPILDEHFVWVPDRAFSVRYRDKPAVYVDVDSVYGQVMAHVPDLLRALVPHLESYRGTGHRAMCEILRDMGITTEKLRRRRISD